MTKACGKGGNAELGSREVERRTSAQVALSVFQFIVLAYLLGLSNAETSGLILSNDDLVISTEEHELGAGDLDSSGGEVGPSRGDGGDLLQCRK
jgi:hypothetical protein